MGEEDGGGRCHWVMMVCIKKLDVANVPTASQSRFKNIIVL